MAFGGRKGEPPVIPLDEYAIVYAERTGDLSGLTPSEVSEVRYRQRETQESRRGRRGVWRFVTQWCSDIVRWYNYAMNKAADWFARVLFVVIVVTAVASLDGLLYQYTGFHTGFGRCVVDCAALFVDGLARLLGACISPSVCPVPQQCAWAPPPICLVPVCDAKCTYCGGSY